MEALFMLFAFCVPGFSGWEVHCLPAVLLCSGRIGVQSLSWDSPTSKHFMCSLLGAVIKCKNTARYLPCFPYLYLSTRSTCNKCKIYNCCTPFDFVPPVLDHCTSQILTFVTLQHRLDGRHGTARVSLVIFRPFLMHLLEVFDVSPSSWEELQDQVYRTTAASVQHQH